MKPVKCVVLILLALAASGVIAAGAASAASTRPEYVAQVDTVCQSFVGPMGDAYARYQRNYKRWVHAATHGTLKQWVKQTRRTAASIRPYLQLHASLTDQLQAVVPPSTDAATVGTWIGDRRQFESLAGAASTALGQIQVRKYFGLIHQANLAEIAGINAGSSLGLQVCGVRV